MLLKNLPTPPIRSRNTWTSKVAGNWEQIQPPQPLALLVLTFFPIASPSKVRALTMQGPYLTKPSLK